MLKLPCGNKLSEDERLEGAIIFTNEEVYPEPFEIAIGDTIYNVRELKPGVNNTTTKVIRYLEKDTIDEIKVDSDGWTMKLRPPHDVAKKFTKSVYSIGSSAFINGEIPDEFANLQVVMNEEDYYNLV